MVRYAICSAGRAATHTTAALLGEVPYTFYLHDAAEADAYRTQARATGLRWGRVVVTDTPRHDDRGANIGLMRQRQRALADTPPGTWVALLDDDIRAFTGVPATHATAAQLPVVADPRLWQRIYDTALTAAEWTARLRGLCAEADRVGAHLAGVSPTRNAFFRAKQWRYVGFCEGTCLLVKRAGPDLYDPDNTLDDWALTAAHLATYGVAVVNNFLFPRDAGSGRGGMGPLRARRADRERDVAALLARYPGLLRRREKATGPDLALRFHSTAQVARWREGLCA